MDRKSGSSSTKALLFVSTTVFSLISSFRAVGDEIGEIREDLGDLGSGDLGEGGLSVEYISEVDSTLISERNDYGDD